jgi:hypothetical protein
MKKTLLLAAALACSGAVAQEKEIWACQQQESAMLGWRSNGWELLLVTPKPLLLTINGASSSYKEGDSEFRIQCSPLEYFEERTTCIDSSGGNYFLLDPETGKMGRSRLSGAINNAYSVAAQIYNCTKF